MLQWTQSFQMSFLLLKKTTSRVARNILSNLGYYVKYIQAKFIPVKLRLTGKEKDSLLDCLGFKGARAPKFKKGPSSGTRERGKP